MIDFDFVENMIDFVVLFILLYYLCLLFEFVVLFMFVVWFFFPEAITHTLQEILRFVREYCQEHQLLANLPEVMPGKPLANCNYKLQNKPGANPWQSAVTPGNFLAGKFDLNLSPLKSRESLHYAEDLTKFWKADIGININCSPLSAWFLSVAWTCLFELKHSFLTTTIKTIRTDWNALKIENCKLKQFDLWIQYQMSWQIADTFFVGMRLFNECCRPNLARGSSWLGSWQIADL